MYQNSGRYDVDVSWATSWKHLFMPYAYNTSICYIHNFKTLGSFWSWAARFVSYLVASLKDSFSHDDTTFWSVYHCDHLTRGRELVAMLAVCLICPRLWIHILAATWQNQ